MRRTVLFIFGTRPEAIKLCPLLLKLRSFPEIYSAQVCVTGQHRGMLDQAIEQAGKSLELDSTFVGGHALFGWAYRGKSLYELAQDLLRRMNFPP